MKKIIIGVVIVVILIIGIFIYLRLTNNDSFKEYESLDNNLERGDSMVIKVSNGDNIITYELNDSTAATDLYNQLPLTLDVEDFSANEKIFYPKSKLDISDTSLADGGSGILAYYEPWGDVVMFYDSFNSNNSLYELGKVIDGEDDIKNLSGEIVMERLEK